MKVLFAVAEADPFAKTGGLGDVGGSLPLAVNQGGCLMTVIMPKYKKIPASLQESMVHIADFTVNLGWRKQGSVLWATEYQGVSYYFIDNEYYFYRDDIYGYDDDKERFAFFSQGVLESILYLKDDKPDILHCNDWHTALIPVMLREHYRDNSFYRGIKTLLTVHNIKHQGIFSKELLGDLLGMREDSLGARSLKFQNAINFFKGGLLTADVISTVSPSYAREIMQPEYGEGLEDIIKKRKDSLSGILNGIDYNKYNPYTDPALTAHYPSPGWKKKNKEELQRYLKLTVEEGVPLFAIVSRLVDQKGLDLLEPIMDEI
jgi:starch synthase